MAVATRRPDPGRRADPGRRTAARAAARRAAPRPGAPAPPRGTLTTRAAVLGLVLCGLVLSAAVPLREFLDQRAEIRRLESSHAAQRARVAGLQEQERLLRDPEHVQRLARERLHFVLPGETAYVLLRPEQPAEPQVQTAPPTGPEQPWWSQLWGSVRTADASGAAGPGAG